MDVLINQKIRTVTKGCTLYQVLSQLDFLNKSGFAVAVNDQIIISSDWSKTLLSEQNEITIITASQGG